MRIVTFAALFALVATVPAAANPNADGPDFDDAGAQSEVSLEGASPESSKRYGLFKTQVEGVTITRGRALNPERTFPSQAERPATAVNLSRNYRGTTFGKHRVVREGKTVYRDKLLSIQQRTDE